jgi:uncharacterized membrane protein
MRIARTRYVVVAFLAGAVLATLPSGPARADLQLCNRTSYVVEAAIGIEVKTTAATRGWFRLDPGQCRIVLQGSVDADHVYVHARALPVYGASPLALAAHADLCIAEGNFIIPGARRCDDHRHRLVKFTEVKPSESEAGTIASLAEEAEYSNEQARLAGIQRLLVIAGYDANPIDGIEGKKTEAALTQFLRDRGLTPDLVPGTGFFDILVSAVKQADGIGFAWCNETSLTVMAALGVEEPDGLVTRGWYRIEAGKCLKPDIVGKPRRLYSFAEAVAADGNVIKRGDKPLSWGGETVLCTRNFSFEISDHKDCAGKGLTPSGFATIDLAGRAGATVRLRTP